MKARIITGLFLLAFGIFFTCKGGWWMWSWVYLVSLVSLYEMFKMLGASGFRWIEFLGYGLVSLSMLSTQWIGSIGFWRSELCFGLTMAVLIFSLFELVKCRVYISSSFFWAKLRMIGFVSLIFPFIYLLRTGPLGMLHFLFVFGVVWCCDILALFGGRFLGRTPLLPKVSPKKTIEGSCIGLLGGVFFAWVVIWFFHLPFPPYMFLAVFVGVFSQIGDLHESLLKRHFGIKDSSSLLPGHGGFYDRADSALFVSPISFFVFSML